MPAEDGWPPYLYLGPGASLTYERTPDSILSDEESIADMSRRVGAVDVAGLRYHSIVTTELSLPTEITRRKGFQPRLRQRSLSSIRIWCSS
jgi:hypothetical protein